MIAEFLHRHRAGVLLVVFWSFSLLCLTLRVEPYIIGIKTSLWFLISPEVVYSGQFFNKLDSLRGRVFSLFRAEGEKYILEQQISRLGQWKIERDALEEENRRLRTLLNLKEQVFKEAVAAQVIAKDTREWFQAVVINKGLKDGIDISGAVVSGSSERPMLIGRIVEVKESTSKVLLITDAVSAIAVLVARTGDMGLLEGRNKPQVAVSYLSPRAAFEVEDEVVTAGLGGVFPPGIPVGQITKIDATKDGFFKEAKVEPYADLSSLLDVLVMQRKEPAVVPAEK